jgi:hypothetical protein
MRSRTKMRAASTRSSSTARNTTTSCRRCARARCTTGPRTPPIRSATSRSRSTAGRRTQASIAASTIRSKVWCDCSKGEYDRAGTCGGSVTASSSRPGLSAWRAGPYLPRRTVASRRSRRRRRPSRSNLTQLGHGPDQNPAVLSSVRAGRCLQRSGCDTLAGE